MMFNQYFGHYILQRGLLTSDQLRKVLSLQGSTRVRLGVLAIEAGLMTAFQVQHVHKLQIVYDKRFGDLACSEGFLTEEALTDLLSRQKNSHVMLGQLLVDEGLLTYEAYEQLLAEYKNDSGFSDAEISTLKKNNTDEIIDLLLRKSGDLEIPFLKAYVELMVRNIVRFIDRDVAIEAPFVTNSFESLHLASQKITGDHAILSGISGPSNAIMEFASLYAEDVIHEVNADCQDAMGEFMNCVNGLFVSNLYHQNITCDLLPQTFDDQEVIACDANIYVFPCHLSFGTVHLIYVYQGKNREEYNG